MPLTAESEAVLQELENQGVPALDALPPTEGRALFNEVFKTQPEDQEPVARVEPLAIPAGGTEIPARLYAPEAQGPLPVLVHFHGGGWVYLNLDTHDGYCRQLANQAGVAIVAVEYRKAPEQPFPAAVEDCYAALCWVADNAAGLGLDPDRIATIGDSAGGNLAAVTAQMARDQGGPALRAQVLTYPAVDAELASPSIKENAEAPILPESALRWFWDHYLGAADRLDPRASPLRASSLAGLPAAFVSTAELDPLRDEGEAYADKLEAAGVPVECRRYDGVFHGFMLLGKFIPEARELIADQAAFLKANL